VGTFRFSRRAETDLLGIGTYTLRAWGEAQTIRYLDGLEACCQMLADNPGAGRPCDDVRPGLCRKEEGKLSFSSVVSPPVLTCPASCMSGCCPEGISSMMQTN
jgi:plasmid stabilization system protein ParE